MKHFFKLVEGVPFISVMNELVQRPNAFADTEIDGVAALPVYPSKNSPSALKKIALSVLTMSEGVQLVGAGAVRVESKAMLKLEGQSGPSCYLTILHGAERSFAMSGGESIPLRSGEIWWIDLKTSDAMLINNSDDEVFALIINVHLDFSDE